MQDKFFLIFNFSLMVELNHLWCLDMDNHIILLINQDMVNNLCILNLATLHNSQDIPLNNQDIHLNNQDTHHNQVIHLNQDIHHNNQVIHNNHIHLNQDILLNNHIHNNQDTLHNLDTQDIRNPFDRNYNEIYKIIYPKYK